MTILYSKLNPFGPGVYRRDAPSRRRRPHNPYYTKGPGPRRAPNATKRAEPRPAPQHVGIDGRPCYHPMVEPNDYRPRHGRREWHGEAYDDTDARYAS